MRRRGLLTWAALMLAIAGCGGESGEGSATPQAAVVVWSDAADFPLGPLLAAYTGVSGVPIEIASDGGGPPARTDMVVTADTGMLWDLGQESGLRPVYSDALEADVPAPLRDPESTWFGVSWNPLVVVHNGSTDTGPPQDFAALAGERWSGRLCLAGSGLAPNRVLLASLIAEIGEAATERLVRGWVANFAEGPLESVDALLASMPDGPCEVAIADAAAVARMQASGAGSSIEAFVPATGAGAFAIVTAAGVTRHATNPEGAAALLEWLSGEQAQAIVASESMVLPVNPSVPARMPLPGSMPTEPFAAALAAGHRQAAALLAERAGYR